MKTETYFKTFFAVAAVGAVVYSCSKVPSGSPAEVLADKGYRNIQVFNPPLSETFMPLCKKGWVRKNFEATSSTGQRVEGRACHDIILNITQIKNVNQIG